MTLNEDREEVRQLYQLAFVKNCHRLLARAYQRVVASTLQHQEEPAITGILVKEMTALTESDDAPVWMRQLIALDDPPQESGKRLGKQRRRVDIEFRWVRRGPRPRLHIEAKRLYRSDSVAEYLGPKGLQLFVEGEYGASQDSGAMLGYVQIDSVDEWINRLVPAIAALRESLKLCLGPEFQEVDLHAELDSVHITLHERPSVGRAIRIYHTLLRCF
jgi:hypothetical protein